MKAVDLFAGCGGLSLGLSHSGMELVGAYENWDPALIIYGKNFRHNAVKLDLSDVDNSIELISQKYPDLIAGGPPCQDFSSAGKRNENGGRADLTTSFAKVVLGIRPNWFLMENVDRAANSITFNKVKKAFSKDGYGLTQVTLDASLCGVPQRRKRVFLIGKVDEKDGFMEDRLLSGLAPKSLTIKEYFGERINTKYYYRHPRSYARRGIFSVDEPSPTIRGVNRPIPPDYKYHPGDVVTNLNVVRPLTSLERAEIQTFPVAFDWSGVNKSTLEQIIGNAVPVKLAEYVGVKIMEYERDEKKLKDSPSRLEKNLQVSKIGWLF